MNASSGQQDSERQVFPSPSLLQMKRLSSGDGGTLGAVRTNFDPQQLCGAAEVSAELSKRSLSHSEMGDLYTELQKPAGDTFLSVLF